MLFSYLKIVARNFMRNRTFSIINILGLTIGLATFLAISLYVADELSYDRFHQKGERIYRSIISAQWDGQAFSWGAVPNKFGPTIAREVPEVEKAARVFHHNYGDIAFVGTETEKFSERNMFFADPDVLDIFTIPLLKGNQPNSLDRPNTVIISERAANKYFGNDEALGKTLTVDNRYTLEVTGVFKTFPANSLLQADLIASFSSHDFGKVENENWGNASFDTYFLLHETAQREEVDKKISTVLSKNIPQDQQWFSIALQPLFDTRLHSTHLNANVDKKSYGDNKQIQVLIALAIVVLLIAAVNYMNLTTAQSQRRNKEVGVAKTLGATFGQLNVKFYFEAAVFVLLSLLLSIMFFSTLLPFFNNVSGKEITTSFISAPVFWVGFVIVWMILTFLSGFYPAWYLSSFTPKATLLKSSGSRGQATIRKGLVVFQFATSVILLVSTVMFYKQMDFIRTKKLGYNPEQVIAVMVSAASEAQQVYGLKKQFESLSGVHAVSVSQSYPGIGTSARTLLRDDDTGQGMAIQTNRSSGEVLDVLGIPLLAGRTLPEKNSSADTVVQVVINRAAAEYLMMTPTELVGKRVRIQGFQSKCEVVGVMDDFHTTSMHQAIGAYCFHNAPTERRTYLLVKVNAGDLPSMVSALEAQYQKVIPSAFEYTFIDQQLERLYDSEQRLSNLVLAFSAIAIFIASLGLYALAAFTAEQRLKEIGIRKVLGASVTGLVARLSREFLVLVLAGLVIGAPVGYYFMDKWLQTFAYRTEFDVFVFAIAGLIALIIASLTVSVQSVRAARMNPVDTLKSE